VVCTKLRKTISKLAKKRHFVASALIVDGKCEKVLLVKHRKLKAWLPPGGHIRENELPDECAVREAKEETSLDVEIVSEAFDVSGARVETIHTPLLAQLEEIDSEHQHIDLQYLCKIAGGKLHEGKHEEHEQAKWFDERMLKESEELQADVRENAFLALEKARELRERGLF